MKFIKSNPFRVIGILANTTEREIQKQKSKITKFVSIGKQVETEYDFPILGEINRTEKSINQAFSAIEQSQEKVNQSLFWFLNTNSFDDTAISYLIKGDMDKAIEVWEKVTIGKELTPKNYSCFNNLGTLYLCNRSIDEMKTGVEIKIKLIESTCLGELVRQVADQTILIDTKIQVGIFVDQVYSQLLIDFSSTDTLKLFQNTGEHALDKIKSKLIEDPIYKIEEQILIAKNNRKANPENAYISGVILYGKCSKEIQSIKEILDKNDLKQIMISDSLSKEIMQCGIDYFNVEIEANDQIKNSLELLNIAKSIASGTQILEIINSNIDEINESKDNEMLSAIEFMKSVKKTYEENKAKINLEVHSMYLGPNQTINIDKVNRMIENSIDWKKVVELLLKYIPVEKINRIKSINDKSKIEEYKSLVDFITQKLSFFQKNKIKYLSYWKTEDTLSNMKFIFTSLPRLVKAILAYPFILLIVWLIWGYSGIEIVNVFAIIMSIMIIIKLIQDRA